MKFRNILINFSLIIFSFLLLEIISSIIIYYKEKKVGFLFSPYKTISKKIVKYEMRWDRTENKILQGTYVHTDIDGIKNKYKINSKGFRGPEFNKTKNKNYRIINFGGSVTMGLESSDLMTYPAQLDLFFKKNMFNVENINMGMVSKSLNYIRDIYMAEAIYYKPDMITIYSNRNSTMYDSIGTKINKNSNQNAKIVKLIFYLKENIMTFRLLFKINRKIISQTISSDIIISPYNDKISHNLFYFKEQYAKTLEEIILSSEKNGIKVVLIKQPFYIDPSIQKKLKNKSIDELLETLKKVRSLDFYGLDYHDSFWMLTNEILNKNIDKFIDYKNVIIVDPIDEMLQDENNFYDMNHLRSKGNKVLAKQIFIKIKDLIN
jgi:hypothetical protein|tara:strand:+ start:3323 stop:4453 length:1131 start_codon:yes stop_codon:yes gene_type:complete